MDSVPKTGSSLGHYQLERLLGQGGFGRVFQARHIQTRRAVAIKVLSAAAAKDRVVLSRFEREFRSAQLLYHPNIVESYDFVTGDGPPYLVMEFVEGETLGKRLERDGALSEPEALQIAVDVCRGLHFAHQAGVIHRDIKPDNILLTSEGGVKIADFGLSKELFAEYGLTRPGQGLGTPYYMAPELFRSAMYADQRSDIYCVAATLYHMVTGRPPFSGGKVKDILSRKIRGEIERPSSFNEAISKPLERAILQGMRIDPTQRQSDLAQLEHQLSKENPLFGTSPRSRPPSKGDFRPLWAVSVEPGPTVLQSVCLSKKMPWRTLVAFLLAAGVTWAITALLM